MNFSSAIVLTAPLVTATSSCSKLLLRVTNTTGIILSNEDLRYSNFMDCHWNISSNAMLQLVFDHFGTNAADSLKVYDGGSSSSPLIGSFTGFSLPGPIFSASGKLHLRFTTDGSGTNYGFLANYRGMLLPTNIRLSPDLTSLH